MKYKNKKNIVKQNEKKHFKGRFANTLVIQEYKKSEFNDRKNFTSQ